MPPHPRAESTHTHGCSIALRRVEGSEASELFFACQPPAAIADAAAQADAIYRALLVALESEGGSFASVVHETSFLRDLPSDLGAVRAAREAVLADCKVPAQNPARVELQQPPLAAHARLEVAVQALLPRAASLQAKTFEANSGCPCSECARSQGLRLQLGGEMRFQAGGLCGAGGNAYEQTLAMFRSAEELLQQAGMEFRDVVRTWIHLRDIDRDYDDLNRARREFFESRGIAPAPASTGIGGGPAGALHDVCLGIYAVKNTTGSPPIRTVMTSPTLNEAPTYGADFVRGMKMVEANKIALHVSGTASIDAAGATAHVGDFDAQADRMLLNVAALLEGQGAGFGDIVSAVTYLKRNADAERLRARFRAAGFEGFPNVWVAADVCRPELLCETEVLAVLPNNIRSATRPSGFQRKP